MATRTLILKIVGDASDLDRTFKGAQRSAKGFDRSISQIGRGAIVGTGAFRSLGRQVAFASSAFLGGAGLVAVLKTSVGAASNLAEQTNKVNVVFGKSARIITDWGATTATSIGIANDQALEAAGTFGNLFTTVGIVGTENAKLSKSLVQLAADLASFNNADPSETLDAIRSGLIGEAEPLRRFGVLLTEGRVQQEAMRATGKKTSSQLTQQDKILARYAITLKDTTVAQGDFARTADSQANAQRTLSAEIRDTEASIGKALLPTVRNITKAFRDWLADPRNQKRIQKDTEKTVDFLGGMVHFLGDVKSGFEDIVGPASRGAAALRKFNDQLADTLGIQSALSDQEKARRGKGGDGLDFGVPFVGEDVITPRRRRQRRPADTSATPPPSGPLGFNARLAKLNLALAKAEVTASQADDRALLRQEAALIRERLTKVKSLKDRTALYEDLARVERQITSIDEQAAQKRRDALQKQREQLQKQRDHLARLRALEDQIRSKITDIQGQFKDAVDTARDAIGQLFAGPVLQPSDEARKRILGVGAPASADAGRLLADLKAQTAAFAAFQKNLNKLAARGAPAELIRELRAQGLGAATETAALAGAPSATLRAFFKAFGKREQLAIRSARTTMRAQLVTLHAARVQLAQVRGREQTIIIELDGKEIARSTNKHNGRAKRRTADQRTGRYAGTSFLTGS